MFAAAAGLAQCAATVYSSDGCAADVLISSDVATPTQNRANANQPRRRSLLTRRTPIARLDERRLPAAPFADPFEAERRDSGEAEVARPGTFHLGRATQRAVPTCSSRVVN